MVKHDFKKLYNKNVRYDEKGQMRLTSNCHGLAIIQFRTTNLLLCMCVTFAVKSFESFEYFDSSFDTVVASRDPGWLNWKLIYCGCSRDRDDSKQGWLIANVNSSGGIADEDHHHHQVRERGTAAVTGVAHRRWLSSFPAAAAPRVSSGSLC